LQDNPRFQGAGIRLAVIGNGRVEHARAFAGERMGSVPLYTDPSLVTYEALGAKRSVWSGVRPSVFGRALQASAKGFVQSSTQGSPFQQGGALGLRPDGSVWFRQISDHAGDHFRTDDVLAAHAAAKA
jgi:hypothetical protein